MRFRLQQIGMFAIAAMLQAYPVLEQLSARDNSVEQPVEVAHIWMSGFSGAILAFVAFRGVGWALWSPERSRSVLMRSGLTEATVVRGRFGWLWQWILDVDKEGKPRNA